MTRFAIPALLAIPLALSACDTNHLDRPLPTQDGFAMTGFVQFTSDEADAKQEIADRMRAACGGPVTFTRLDLEPWESIVGVRHIAYNAVVRCGT